MRLNIKINIDDLIEKCFIFITMFNLFYHQILKRIIFGDFVGCAITVSVITIFIYRNYRRISLLTVGIYLFVSILTLLNILIFQIEEAFNILPQYLLFTVPALFAGSVIDFYKNEKFIQSIGAIYIVSNFIFVLSVASKRSAIAANSIDHMAFAYQALPYVLISLYEFKKNRQLFNGIMAILSLVYIVACGTRGPVVCILVFGLLMFLKDIKNYDTKKIIKIMSVILAIIVTFLNVSNIVEWLVPIFEKYRLSTRILYSLIATSSSTFSSGRDNIYRIILNNINQHAAFGTGLMSDRLLLNGTWSHNFVLEVINDFGIPIGGVILAALSILIIKAAWLQRNQDFLNVIIIYFSCTIIKLMMSATFLTEFNLYFFIGICCKGITQYYSLDRDGLERIG